jgi:hypothetical protein
MEWTNRVRKLGNAAKSSSAMEVSASNEKGNIEWIQKYGQNDLMLLYKSAKNYRVNIDSLRTLILSYLPTFTNLS